MTRSERTIVIQNFSLGLPPVLLSTPSPALSTPKLSPRDFQLVCVAYLIYTPHEELAYVERKPNGEFGTKREFNEINYDSTLPVLTTAARVGDEF
jgi:hypothetical protein